MNVDPAALPTPDVGAGAGAGFQTAPVTPVTGVPVVFSRPSALAWVALAVALVASVASAMLWQRV